MIRFTILGEPASKSNSRKLATIGGRNVTIDGKKTRVGGRAAFIKSQKALDYITSGILQIPTDAKQMLTGHIRVTIRIFYASERPDLDESVILDMLQARYSKIVRGQPRELIRRGVYVNDRQIKERHVYWGIDRVNPRAEIEVEPMHPQQVDLLPPAPEKAPMRARRAPSAARVAIPQDREPF